MLLCCTENLIILGNNFILVYLMGIKYLTYSINILALSSVCYQVICIYVISEFAFFLFLILANTRNAFMITCLCTLQISDSSNLCYQVFGTSGGSIFLCRSIFLRLQMLAALFVFDVQEYRVFF